MLSKLFFKYACFITGSNPDNVDYRTNNRIVSYAIAVHIPVALWLLSGYAITHILFKQPTMISLSVGLFTAGLIYLIERLILSIKITLLSGTARILIALLVALLGSICVDEIIFANDIHQQVQIANENICKSKTQTLVDEKYDLWVNTKSRAENEMQGKGSGLRGVGNISKILLANANNLKSDYETTLLQSQKSNKQCVTDAMGSIGLLTSIKALMGLAMQDKLVLTIWGLLFAFTLLLEAVVIIVKMAFKDLVTADDLIRDTQAEMIKEHTIRNSNQITNTLNQSF